MSGLRMSYSEAIRRALTEELRRDENVILMGEDIAEYGGAFRVTRGLAATFGTQRIRNTPISEGGFTGVAVGAAMTGLRPVVEIMFMDFITLAADQLVNHAAKIHYMYDGRLKVPLVVRTPAGAGRGYGASHSQSLEAWFCHIPGLKVVYPSTPADALGLLKSAIRDDNPVLFIENKLLYPEKGPVPEGEHLVEIGKARVARIGTDITLVCYGRTVGMALDAAEQLAGRADVEVVDLRTLAPLDIETVATSLRKTARLMIVGEDTKTGGLGAEIAATVAEDYIDFLDAPIARIACADVTIPCSPLLEAAALPSAEKIAARIEFILSEYRR